MSEPTRPTRAEMIVFFEKVRQAVMGTGPSWLLYAPEEAERLFEAIAAALAASDAVTPAEKETPHYELTWAMRSDVRKVLVYAASEEAAVAFETAVNMGRFVLPAAAGEKEPTR